MTLDVDFEVEDRSLKVAQFVSSSLKHGGRVSKRALNMLGRTLLKDHERVGWEHPTDELKGSGVRARIAQRAANTDEWNEDAPVLLAPTVADKLGVRVEPDLRERRTYAKTSGPRQVRLIGEHNVGLVIIGPKKARQELLCRGDRRIDIYETLIDLGSGTSA
jgi:hypothetical protein